MPKKSMVYPMSQVFECPPRHASSASLSKSVRPPLPILVASLADKTAKLLNYVKSCAELLVENLNRIDATIELLQDGPEKEQLRQHSTLVKSILDNCSPASAREMPLTEKNLKAT